MKKDVRLTGGHDVFSEMYNHVVTIGPFEEDVCIIKLAFIKMLLLQAHYYNAVILYRSYFYAERALPGNVLARHFSSTGMIGMMFFLRRFSRRVTKRNSSDSLLFFYKEGMMLFLEALYEAYEKKTFVSQGDTMFFQRSVSRCNHRLYSKKMLLLQAYYYYAAYPALLFPCAAYPAWQRPGSPFLFYGDDWACSCSSK